jgi:hypothetical protein
MFFSLAYFLVCFLFPSTLLDFLKYAILGMEANVCIPSTWEAKAGRLQVPGQSGLQSETLSQKIKK